jgi:hypothetical protein
MQRRAAAVAGQVDDAEAALADDVQQRMTRYRRRVRRQRPRPRPRRPLALHRRQQQRPADGHLLGPRHRRGDLLAQRDHQRLPDGLRWVAAACRLVRPAQGADQLTQGGTLLRRQFAAG